MKALTLHNPWSYLVSIGAKTYETRSWRTHYRGLLAIHASLNMNHWDHTLYDVRADDPTFIPPWDRHCNPDWGWMFGEVHYGSIVAICRLKACYPAYAVGTHLKRLLFAHSSSIARRAAEELAFGDFSPGRWAWELDVICACDIGLTVRGRQGLWNLPPDYEQLLLTSAAAYGIYPTAFKQLTV